MYYIISPLPINELKKYHIPYKENSCNRNIEVFINTQEGKEFIKISPLKIRRSKNKKYLLEEIAADIFLLGLCYNQTLYIGVLSDLEFNSKFNFGMCEYVNFGKCVEMQERNMKSKIPASQRYMSGDFEKIYDECCEKMNFNLKKNSFWEYILNENLAFNINGITVY